MCCLYFISYIFFFFCLRLLVTVQDLKSRTLDPNISQLVEKRFRLNGKKFKPIYIVELKS